MKFADHRLRPAVDLLNRVDLESPALVYDLGAGSGNVTELLARRWPGARVTGVDNSEEMLRRAARLPNVEWRMGDIAAWRPERPADLVFSNAALHWLQDHAGLFTGLMHTLASGGVLAVQMPRNFAAPSHTSIAAAAMIGPWRRRLEPLLRPSPVQPPQFYLGALAPLSAVVDVWETEYIQVLTGDNPVKEWTKGTWLRPLLEALEEPERAEFESAYADLVARAYPKQADGTTLFPFKRLFIVARRR
jgi:trans-aconitate 2-methyltransferase